MLNQPTISVGKVLDQMATEEIVYLPSDEIQGYLHRYQTVMEELPPPSIAPTVEQLACMKFIIEQKRAPYTDFALWTKPGQHVQHALKFSGLIFCADGTFRNQEMPGPPNFEQWEESFDVLTAALIMLDVVRRPTLAQYKAQIRKLHNRYGTIAWALLYSCDMTARRELMESTKYEMHLAHDRAIHAGSISHFNPDKPWDAVWTAVAANKDFWREDFEVPASFLVFGRTPSAGSSSEPRLAPTPVRPQPKATPQQDRPVTQLPICAGYTAGTCNITNKGYCGKNAAFSHRCGLCSKLGHSTPNCRTKGGGRQGPKDKKTKKDKKGKKGW
jgi:hypothetical protein